MYDAEGRRAAKGSLTTFSCDITANGFTATEKYVLGQGGEQLVARDGAGNWKRTNVLLDGVLLGTYDANSDGFHYAFGDWLGTKRVQYSLTQGVEETCSSLPYGDSLSCNGFDATDHHFTGKERDAESGNDYFGARYYASRMGRFLSPDWSAKVEPVPYAKLGNPQSLNLYSYVWNNPLSRNDPDGHYTCADGAKCDSANDKTFQGRLDNLKAAQGTFKEGSKEYKQIGKILSAYGGAGDTKTANGKTVSIGFSGGANTGGVTKSIDKGTIGVSLLRTSQSRHLETMWGQLCSWDTKASMLSTALHRVPHVSEAR